MEGPICTELLGIAQSPKGGRGIPGLRSMGENDAGSRKQEAVPSEGWLCRHSSNPCPGVQLKLKYAEGDFRKLRGNKCHAPGGGEM